MKIIDIFGDLILGYLEQFAPIFLILGTIFIGAYVSPILLSAIDNMKNDKTEDVEA